MKPIHMTGTAFAAALALALTAGAQTARLGNLPGNALVVTNVAGFGLASTQQLAEAVAPLATTQGVAQAGAQAALALAAASNALAQADAAHAAQRNPHGTAAADVGAATPAQVAAVSNALAQADAAHAAQRNPHRTTAADVGAITNEQDLAALRTYHYGSPDIVESPEEWFAFDGAGTITAFNWEAGRTNVVIPWAIGGVPVTAIGANAFYGDDSGFPVTSVIAPQTVTVIGDGAFGYCYSLTSVTIPQATSIGDYAFSSCYTLTSVTIPQATSIGDFAFADCYTLTPVTIPQATTIGNYAFFYCSELTAVHMGQNAPAEATGVFGYITPPPTVYVTNPQATGWGAVWNGVPVVRPPLYGSSVTAQAFTLNGDTITEWPSGSVPYADWTGTVTPQNGTATVTYAHGNMPVLVTDAPCVLTLDPTGYGTAGVSRVSLSYYTGTNSFTFATNIIGYAETPTVDTNGWNTLLIRRVSNGAWKGVGL